MPESTHSPMFNPAPLTKADYKLFNWNDLASRMTVKMRLERIPKIHIPVNKPKSQPGIQRMSSLSVSK